MSAAQHTPGPWASFSMAAYGHGIAPVNAAGHRLTDCIAVVHFADKSRGQTTEGQKANARLIAAAPELLEALRRVRPLIKKDMEDGFGVFNEHDLRTVDAAIAKGTGSSAS